MVRHVAQRPLGLLEVGDVGATHDVALDEGITAQVGDGDVEGDAAAVGALESKLESRSLVGAEQRIPHVGAVAGMNQVGEGHASDERGVVVEQPRQLAVGRLDRAVRIEGHEKGGGVMHERPQSVVVARSEFEPVTIGDVAQDHHDEVLAVVTPFDLATPDLDLAPPVGPVSDAHVEQFAPCLGPDPVHGCEDHGVIVGVEQVEDGPSDPGRGIELHQVHGGLIQPHDVPAQVEHGERIG